MAFAVVTQNQLWDDLGDRVSVARNATTGVLEPTMKEKAQMCALLNEATDYIWYCGVPMWAWACTVESKSVTVTANKVSWSDIANSLWFRLYEADPRLSFDGTPALPVEVRGSPDVDGIHIRHSSVTPLYVFYQRAVPLFTHVAVDTGATYNTVGTLVYDSATMFSYKSIATGALGSALTNTAKWTVQQLPELLRWLVVRRARAMHLLQHGNMTDNAKAEFELSELEIARVKARLDKGFETPWML